MVLDRSIVPFLESVSRVLEDRKIHIHLPWRATLRIATAFCVLVVVAIPVVGTVKIKEVKVQVDLGASLGSEPCKS